MQTLNKLNVDPSGKTRPTPRSHYSGVDYIGVVDVDVIQQGLSLSLADDTVYCDLLRHLPTVV